MQNTAKIIQLDLCRNGVERKKIRHENTEQVIGVVTQLLHSSQIKHRDQNKIVTETHAELQKVA